MTATGVFVAGSANLDFVVRSPHVPAPGETVLGRDAATFPGGKGANQAVAAARAGGAEVAMLLALGDDAFAPPLEQALAGAGVRAHIVRVAGAASGSAFVCVADDGENAITVAPGANLQLQATQLPALDGVACLLMQLEIPLATVQACARAARAAGVRVVLNAAPVQALPEALRADIDVLIVNEGELAGLAGARGVDAQSGIATQCSALGVPCVVTTLGAKGALLWRADGTLEQRGFAVDAIDTTGAGDVFCGVFTAGLARGAGEADALREAVAASALACTRIGAQSGTPARDELEAFLRKHSTP